MVLVMAVTCKYTILTAVPDPRRGERVNVGIVVFRDSGLDVRFRLAAHKLKALTGETWDSRIQSIQSRILHVFEEGMPPEEMLLTLGSVDPIISTAGLGTVNVASDSEYERAIQEIIATLVLLPQRKQKPEIQTRINTEIAKRFKADKVLAKPDEGINKKKIVRGLPVAPNEGLSADFALQNGKYNVASTLDLRKHTSLAEAALKSIILDKSAEVFGENTRKIGVYALERDMKDQYRQHVRLLSDYADETYNWLEPARKRKFIRTLYDAIPAELFQ
jgi:Protein of unknown function (DUF3037)